ncbi:MAG: hypothetical protein RIR70_1266 [Pseudomonadota bacterium]|jgi:rare lipoprotein A
MTRGGLIALLIAVSCHVSAQGGGAKRGGYYLDDGPLDFRPEQLALIADAEPRGEPLHRFANNPYVVFGVEYVPQKQLTEFTQRGIASWYGRRFHGQRTSSGEPYDMFAMTAAHPTLPIPSYARVTHLGNGKSVVVRINDRGPFHAGRVIDLSFTAAWKLGYANMGSTMVEVSSIVNDELITASMAPAPKPQLDLIEQIIRAEAKKQADEAPTDMPAIKDARGVYLQLAAFSNKDNAESFRNHLARELGPLGDKLIVHAAAGLHRLRLGPYNTPQEARRVAERIREMLDVKVVLVENP